MFLEVAIIVISMGKTISSSDSKVVKNILSGGLRLEDRYISDKKTLDVAVRTLKQAGYRIVLTQGVYDLFHVGHKRYLEAAKGHGDILIVGLDTDELTRKMKGPSRPFDRFEDRLEILASLKAVDIVTPRHEHEHMYQLIRLVQPDVLVMSQTTSSFTDKDQKNLIRYCGEIKILPSQASTSTTAKLRRMMVEGAEDLGRRMTQLISDFLSSMNSNESTHRIHSGNTRRSSRNVRKAKTRLPVRSRSKS